MCLPYDIIAYSSARAADTSQRNEKSGDLLTSDECVDFYMLVASGNWTSEFTGKVADKCEFKSRSHTAFWCLRFQFPRSKPSTYSCHSERGAWLLAKRWATVAHHWYEPWLESEGALIVYTEENMPEPDLQFLDWACALDADSESFARVPELHKMWPRMVAKA